MYFSVAQIDIFPLLPPIIALAVSFFTSMGGVSGAFLLLPFQISVLHFDSPAVSPTNLIFNIVAIPSGVYRYIREKRMAWPLTWVVILATLPGVFIGAIVRIEYLPDPRSFKFFIGFVLAYIGLRLFLETIIKRRGDERVKELEKRFQERFSRRMTSQGSDLDVTVHTLRISWKEIAYEFYGEEFSFNPVSLFILAFVVGIIGGTYGIGGGAIIAPFLITFFRLPVYTIAGAALMGTFITSIAGVVFYCLIAPHYAETGLAIRPDWALGFLFGIGGSLGTYCGARLQKYMPAKAIRLLLAIVILFLAFRYIWQFFI